MKNNFTHQSLPHKKQEAKRIPWSYLIALMLVFAYPPNIAAQDLKVIKGTVTDSRTNRTLPNVNVLVKGTNRGVLTGPDGSFSI